MTAAGAYRAVALGDLLLFSVLAIPFLGGLVLEWIVGLNAALGLRGSLQISASLLLLLHLAGLMGVGLAWMRLRSGAIPHAVTVTICVKLGAALLFALFVWSGAPMLFAVFGAVDAAQASMLLLLCLKKSGTASTIVSERHN